MRRGLRTNYLMLFPQDEIAEKQKGDRRGRSDDLVKKRNESLIDRHFFFVKHKGYNYPKCLDELEKEYFISQYTIALIIQQNNDQLKQLQAQKPAVSYFKKKYAHLNWH